MVAFAADAGAFAALGGAGYFKRLNPAWDDVGVAGVGVAPAWACVQIAGQDDVAGVVGVDHGEHS